MARAGAEFRAMVVDDHPSVAEALAAALDAQPDISVVGWASTPRDALALVGKQVDVALVDVHLSPHDGLELAQELLGRHPALRLVLMSDEADPSVLEDMLAVGARGYVNKAQHLQHIVDAVRGAREGQIAVPASLLAQVLGRAAAQAQASGVPEARRGLLTDRELEVLGMIAQGWSTKDIAAQLRLSVNTVRSHAQNILTKLGVGNRLQAVAKGREAGLLNPPPRSS